MKLVLVQPLLSYTRDRGNLDCILDTLRTAIAEGAAFDPNDIVLLPEHYDLRASRDEYLTGVREVAALTGTHVIGGSHHEQRATSRVNSGVVIAPDGSLLTRYEKIRPYAREREWVNAGETLGEVVIGGRRFLLLICADFWFSDLFDRASALPDAVLVPALSVTRKPTPDCSRALWKHLAIARAYEFGAYVGISDWAHPQAGVVPFTSGVSGFADPTREEPELLFQPVDTDAGSLETRAYRVFDLDFDRLDAFRRDRTERGFFWRKPPNA